MPPASAAKKTSYQNVIVGVDIKNHKGITNENLEITEIRHGVRLPSTTGGINWNWLAGQSRYERLVCTSNNVCMDYPESCGSCAWWLSCSATQKTAAEDFDGQVGMFSAITLPVKKSGPIVTVELLVRC